MCLLSVVNLTMFSYFYKYSLKNSTLYLWLFFESLSIFESCQISIFKFFVNIIDLRSANGLSSKATLLFFLDILHDIMSLIIFLVFIFVFILNNFSNLPLHMTADIIHVVKTLISRFKSFQRYRELTKNIENKFIDATEEELKEVGTCIICRDELKEGSKKLSCSHIFHVECLKSWFIQQQTCPICRTEIKPQTNKQTANNNNNNANATTVKENEKKKTQQEKDEKDEKEKKKHPFTIQEIITKPNFLSSEENLFYLNTLSNNMLNDDNTKEEVAIMLNEDLDETERMKLLTDLCYYYRELCLFCLKEIDKINRTATPANVMIKNIYGSLNYNILNKNTEDDDITKYLNKMSHIPQMVVFKNYLKQILITDMKYIKNISIPM
uniref:RING-type E3 ubiquitin transferase n=1 Tax=Piliocolobus tephrosceles TaxID=591936 RepID=A0A8C9HAK0_9PRIM